MNRRGFASGLESENGSAAFMLFPRVLDRKTREEVIDYMTGKRDDLPPEAGEPIDCYPVDGRVK